MSKNDPKCPSAVNRRDFLAGVSALPLLGLGMAKSALSAERAGEAAPDGEIHRYAVFPTLGVARVGNSEQWFIGPEVPGMPPRTSEATWTLPPNPVTISCASLSSPTASATLPRAGWNCDTETDAMMMISLPSD